MDVPSARSTETAECAQPVPLTEPQDGIPVVVADPPAVRQAAERLAGGVGPVAIDTERASGYRYSQRAYLIQLRREGAGTVLVDPIAVVGHLDPLINAVSDVEWVLHAASQDLPCLAELGLRPQTLFDTELAGRLCGFERVSLGIMVERLLGFHLEKGHGAADWSRRPLPVEWLNYAALDVELLVPLRNVLEQELRDQGKLAWAHQEFAAALVPAPTKYRAEAWRRVSGINRARTPRQLAAVRALWEARDAVARQRDIAPGRVLPDNAIMEAVLADPTTEAELITLPIFRGKGQRRLSKVWIGALRKARTEPKSALPTSAPAHDGPPPASRWPDRDPQASVRLAAAKETLATIAHHYHLPVENLLLPELVRRLCWTPPMDITPAGIAEALSAGRARPWQIELTAGPLSVALAAAPAEPT